MPTTGRWTDGQTPPPPPPLLCVHFMLFVKRSYKITKQNFIFSISE